MKELKQRDEIIKREGLLKYNAIGTVALTFVVIALLFFMANLHKNRTVQVVIPPAIEGQVTLVLGVNHSSKETYGVFGQYFARLVGNYSYRNIDDVIKNLTRFYSYNLQHQEYTRLQNTAKAIKSNYITQVFTPQSYDVRFDRRGIATVTVEGLMTRTIGKTSEIVDFPYAFEFKLMTYNANIYIVAPIKGGFHAKTLSERNILKKYRETNRYLDFTSPKPTQQQKKKGEKK
ncbi:MAG: hypothetical protein B6D63_02835 [Candidatus Latescibacteria bacterium 4484_7]|nr:MAG: hypothetical protein B6D63_02835 [Candidatus Latescibacteria bacterium 4484_7]